MPTTRWLMHTTPAASATRSTPPVYADDLDRVADLMDTAAREDHVWADLPVPISVTLPVEGAMQCEVVLPACYEARYSYPLLVWLQPDADCGFRERMSLISDRNYIGVGLYWPGFCSQPRQSIPHAAECYVLVRSALSTVHSYWNCHAQRQYVVAEGAAPCAWAARLAEYAPWQFSALVCMEPAAWLPTAGRWHHGPARSHQRLLVIAHDPESVVTWQRAGTDRGWIVESHAALPSDNDAARSRVINSWLMSQVVGR